MTADIGDLVRSIMEHAHRGEEIKIEPARGETYASSEPNIYAYGVYEKGSVLEGQTKRSNLGPIPEDLTPQFFVNTCFYMLNIKIEVLDHTLWHENLNSVDHLPDGPDL